MSVWDGDEKETATNVVSTGERDRERVIRVGVRKREFCVCVRETVVGKGGGSRSCVCVSVRERERGDGSRGCLIGVSLGWRRKGDCNKCCVYRRERE